MTEEWVLFLSALMHVFSIARSHACSFRYLRFLILLPLGFRDCYAEIIVKGGDRFQSNSLSSAISTSLQRSLQADEYAHSVR